MEEYVPLAQRQEQERAQRRALLGKTDVIASTSSQPTTSEARVIPTTTNNTINSNSTKTALSTTNNNYTKKQKTKTLLEINAEIYEKEKLDPLAYAKARQLAEEKRLLEEALRSQTSALTTHAEKATGVVYNTPMPAIGNWRPPTKERNMSIKEGDALRGKYQILLDGEHAPPPMDSFRRMRFPNVLLNALAEKGIRRPTPIQMQGLPCALSGRDMIGIAFTGSGKTITFVLPLIMLALEEELKLPLSAGEGPIGMILCPSRELAYQTWQVVTHFTDRLDRRHKCHQQFGGNGDGSHNGQQGGHKKRKRKGGNGVGGAVVPPKPLMLWPEIRVMLAVGGEDKRAQLDVVRRGCHIICATPGRLKDFLQKDALNLNLCRYICLDEADRMMDYGFDEDIQNIFSYFKRQRQTLLFSATMPRKFREFARESLVQPVIVNSGRAGAANLDVIQEVEYVKNDSKIVYLLECLQKTSPPVVIFSARTKEVDDIHEYLLIKGLKTVSIHGSKDQEERREGMRQFKAGEVHVLVATDVAAKGLDFPDIQHVINFDMPEEIENYIHRIGRTGRCGKTGVATTFINGTVEESILLDLKGVLLEAKQHIPPVLERLHHPQDEMSEELRKALDEDAEKDGLARGCAFCGGLEHRITNCPKLMKDQRRLNPVNNDAMRIDGGGDW
jgi:ATP-dependent RNA helicase DDX41